VCLYGQYEAVRYGFVVDVDGVSSVVVGVVVFFVW